MAELSNPRYPTNPDGKPDLTAGASKTANGRVDFSGIWYAAQTRCPGLFLGTDGTCMELPQPLLRDAIRPNLPYQPWAASAVQKRRGYDREDPYINCLPLSFPRAYVSSHMLKIVQTPDILLMLNEWNGQFRQIFLDGRPLPIDPQPSWLGYSTGRWDGDTLVITTTGFRDDTWLDKNGDFISDQATVVERLSRATYGTLDVEVTVTDPKVYTEPWRVNLKQAIVTDTELLDEVCLENNAKSISHVPSKQ